MLMSYEYKITAEHCWYNDERCIVKMYFLNGVPFTFDELPFGHLWDKDLVEEANKNDSYEIEDVYHGSSYLILEQAHPCFDFLEIENIEELPEDLRVTYDEEDLLG